MMRTDRNTIEYVGYHVQAADGRPVGAVEAVRPEGYRLHRLAGHPGEHGFMPSEAVADIDRATNTIILIPGIFADTVVDAPPPGGEETEGWRMSAGWWADLLGHYGLYESEGRGNEPFLHPDQH